MYGYDCEVDVGAWRARVTSSIEVSGRIFGKYLAFWGVLWEFDMTKIIVNFFSIVGGLITFLAVWLK